MFEILDAEYKSIYGKVLRLIYGKKIEIHERRFKEFTNGGSYFYGEIGFLDFTINEKLLIPKNVPILGDAISNTIVSTAGW